MGLVGELPFEVVQTLQGLGDVLELKEAARQPEVSLQVGGVQRQGLQTVAQAIVMITVPGRNEGGGGKKEFKKKV